MQHRSTLARLGAVTAATGLITLSVAGTASAHVTVTPDGTAAGSYTVLHFSVPHGCDGSPTTKIAIQMPTSIPEATPTRNPFYDLSVKTEKLRTPITAEDGDQITTRDAVITYTAKTPLPADERDTMELSVQLPDKVGETLVFPVVQTCEQGSTAWTEVPASGQSADDLEHPAPSLTVTAADGSGHGDSSDSSDSADGSGSGESDGATVTTASADDSDDSDGDSSSGLAIGGLVAGVLGLLLGGAAFVRSGRGSSRADRA